MTGCLINIQVENITRGDGVGGVKAKYPYSRTTDVRNTDGRGAGGVGIIFILINVSYIIFCMYNASSSTRGQLLSKC